jgi:hypothetical protein
MEKIGISRIASRIWKNNWIKLPFSSTCAQAITYQRIIKLGHRCCPVDVALGRTLQIKDVTQAPDFFLKSMENYVLFDLKTVKPVGSGPWKIKTHALSAAGGSNVLIQACIPPNWNNLCE